MEILRTENLSHIYSPKSPFEHRALDDVSLSIETGTLTGIIGRTGSGKSTLISHFNGLLRPTSGKVFVDGEDIWNEPKKIRRIRFKVGLVFQFPEYQLFEDTVEKDIAFGPKNMGLSEDEVALRVREAADTVGLSAETLKKSPFELSGGQKQRIAIVRSLVMNPELMLFDEPTSALDPEMVNEVVAVMSDIAKHGMTMVVVTHDMSFVKNIASRVLFMDNGEIISDEPPEKLFKNCENVRVSKFLNKLI